MLTIWLKRYPESMHGKAITLSILFSASDLVSVRQRAIEEAVESKVSELLHEKPKKWMSYLRQNLGCNVSTSDSDAFIERKAARDTLEHHNGEVDKSYIEKAGTAAIYKVDEKIDPDDTIIDALYDLVKKLVQKISDDAKLKADHIETKTKAD